MQQPLARLLYLIAAVYSISASASNTQIELKAKKDVLTNSTLHIPAAQAGSASSLSNDTSTAPSATYYRYIITLERPQIIIAIITVSICALSFLLVLVNLIIFSCTHQQSQKEKNTSFLPITSLVLRTA